LSDEELQEIRALHTLFEELDLDVVYSVYMGCNRDRHEATKELGELVQQPQKLEMYVASLVQRMRPPGGPCPSMGEEEGHLPSSKATLPPSYGAGIDGRDALPAMQDSPTPSRRPEQHAYEQQEQGGPWQQAFTLGETLTDVGSSLAEGVTLMAHNITGWVADLVSAGWGDEDEEDEAYEGNRRYSQDQPSRGYGGSLDQNTEHLHHRRGAGMQRDAMPAPAAEEHAAQEPTSFFDQPFFSDGDSDLEEDEEDIKKDA